MNGAISPLLYACSGHDVPLSTEFTLLINASSVHSENWFGAQTKCAKVNTFCASIHFLSSNHLMIMPVIVLQRH
jgi:hypothetical protein